MRTTDAARDLARPRSPKVVTGSPEDRRQARDEWHRHRYTAEVMRSTWRRSRAQTSSRCGSGWSRTRDGHRSASAARRPDRLRFTNAVAYFVDAAASPSCSSDRARTANRAELERKQAEREQREAAPKPRPAWTNR